MRHPHVTPDVTPKTLHPGFKQGLNLLAQLDLRFRYGTTRGQLDPWPLGLNGKMQWPNFTMTPPCPL